MVFINRCLKNCKGAYVDKVGSYYVIFFKKALKNQGNFDYGSARIAHLNLTSV